MLVLIVGLEIRDGEYGAPAVAFALIAAAAGVPLFHAAQRYRSRASVGSGG